jgi:hypothetical protein
MDEEKKRIEREAIELFKQLDLISMTLIKSNIKVLKERADLEKIQKTA